MKQMLDSQLVQSLTFAAMLILPLFAFWVVFAVREVFRLSALRSLLVVLTSGAVMIIVGPFLLGIFGTVLGSPFLLIFFFILLRGYFSELTRGQRARFIQTESGGGDAQPCGRFGPLQSGPDSSTARRA